jgi:hypothetical protein
MKEITLTQGKVALVSDKDYRRLSQWKWYAYRTTGGLWYARRGKRPQVHMHTEILGGPTDHSNGDGLDNRRSNLRRATKAQNGRNRKLNSNSTSGYKGVSWNKGRQRWSAQIRVDGKQIYLGLFTDPAEAASVYDEAAVRYHGEYARTNDKLTGGKG